MKGIVLFKSACVLGICWTILTFIQTDQQWQIHNYQERTLLQVGIDPDMLDSSNKVSGNELDGRQTVVNFTDHVNRYFKVKQDRINAHDYNFTVASVNSCKEKRPFLLVMCLSKFSDTHTRRVIRNTWASVVNTGKWPLANETIENVTMVFLLGRPDEEGVSISDELETFRDIVVIDFHDSYDNLTTKVLMGFKWVMKYCPSTKYVLKVDQDTFVHIPNLINYLKTLSVPDNGLLAGRVNYKSEVFREGRWNLSWEQFPFEYYPPYLSGNTYVISGNILRRMTEIAEHMPYLKIEDVFFTGIVRRILGAEIHNRPGFTYYNQTRPRLCSFHNSFRISATNTDDAHKVKLWQALHVNMTNCYVPNVRKRSPAAD